MIVHHWCTIGNTLVSNIRHHLPPSLFGGDYFKDVYEEALALHTKMVQARTGSPTIPQPVGFTVRDFRNGGTTQSATTSANNGYGGSPLDMLTRRITSASIQLQNSDRFTGSFDSQTSLYRFLQLFDNIADQYDIPGYRRIRLMIYGLKGAALE